MVKVIKKLILRYISYKQSEINDKNRSRLTNQDFTLICSNCAGGIIYHSLSLQFKSPFINLYLSNNDFLYAMENFEIFMKTDVVEDTQSTEQYPVGIGFGGVRIHFMHYQNFAEAIEKWNERKMRVNTDNMAIMLTNFNDDYSVLERFERLPYANKIVFTKKEYPEFKSAVFLKGFSNYSRRVKNRGGVPNIWGIQNPITCKRFIDQFDYVTYFNNIKRNDYYE